MEYPSLLELPLCLSAAVSIEVKVCINFHKCLDQIAWPGHNVLLGLLGEGGFLLSLCFMFGNFLKILLLLFFGHFLSTFFPLFFLSEELKNFCVLRHMTDDVVVSFLFFFS